MNRPRPEYDFMHTSTKIMMSGLDDNFRKSMIEKINNVGEILLGRISMSMFIISDNMRRESSKYISDDLGLPGIDILNSTSRIKHGVETASNRQIS